MVTKGTRLTPPIRMHEVAINFESCSAVIDGSDVDDDNSSSGLSSDRKLHACLYSCTVHLHTITNFTTTESLVGSDNALCDSYSMGSPDHDIDQGRPSDTCDAMTDDYRTRSNEDNTGDISDFGGSGDSSEDDSSTSDMTFPSSLL